MKSKVNNEQRRKAEQVTAKVLELLGDVTLEEVQSRRRTPRITTARYLIMWVLYAVCRYSSTEVATLIGRDHSTVLYGVQNVNIWRTLPKAYAKEVRITKHFKP